jgi:histidinol-phosphate aminotransferase
VPRVDARYHGDQAAVDGMLDFAVNVRGAEPPSWLVERLVARLDGQYLRAAVRPDWPTLVEALVESTAGEVPR